MRWFSKTLDVATIGSSSPLRRLVAYYVVVVGITVLLLWLFPTIFNPMFSGERLRELTATPKLLQDGLNSTEFATPALPLSDRLNMAIVTVEVMLGTLVLMLPVSWVYMSERQTRGYRQSIVQTLIILPIVVAGIILIVRNSIALAFGLAGIMAGVRFRNTLKDPRDLVFVFLAIGVGLAAGVQAMTVAWLISMLFNFVLLIIWRSDFGRSVLEPHPASHWSEPLSTLADGNGQEIPDRDLMLALDPKKANALADRFERLRGLMGKSSKKRGRYNAVLWVTTEDVSVAQRLVEQVLEQTTKRWRLDEVITNEGKPSELYYLIKVRKKTPRDEVLTAVRAGAGSAISGAELEASADFIAES